MAEIHTKIFHKNAAPRGSQNYNSRTPPLAGGRGRAHACRRRGALDVARSLLQVPRREERAVPAPPGTAGRLVRHVDRLVVWYDVSENSESEE